MAYVSLRRFEGFGILTVSFSLRCICELKCILENECDVESDPIFDYLQPKLLLLVFVVVDVLIKCFCNDTCAHLNKMTL